MRGIDISNYQTNIDFNKVKASGIEIIYIKATEGLTYNNPSMRSQYDSAKSAGLKAGFYHYLRANNPIQEANHFLSVIEGLQVDVKHVVDVEEILGQTVAQISSNVLQFMNCLKDGCIYTGESFYKNNLDNSIKNIPLWVAHYGVAKPDVNNYVGFQSTNLGRINGVNGLVDIDEFSSGILLNNVVLTSHPQSQAKPLQTVYNIRYLQHQLNLQCSGGLAEDNIAGPKTLSKCPTIKHGASGNITRWLQNKIGAGIDGDFGIKTLICVQKYQQTHKLQKDGIVGENTWKSLLNL